VDSSGSRLGPGGGSCEYGNETSVSIEAGEFLENLNDYLLLKKDSVPWSWLSHENRTKAYPLHQHLTVKVGLLLGLPELARWILDWAL
jgi:hypothetical protein